MLEQAIPRYRPTLADWRAAVDGLEAQGPPADAVVDHHARWDNTDWLEATWYGPADPEEES